ncbi:SDR family NAD(P)-dependent oxidoreductase [Rhodococcus opacus]|uniref:SDR family NAD(P)-dependent oxidoreductase n=1 Tax=Rhodococcus opacus TaxID=37919 RepID=UPI00237B7AC6|nr:SDR family oxidoreductase [Rhodococcus opacus]
MGGRHCGRDRCHRRTERDRRPQTGRDHLRNARLRGHNAGRQIERSFLETTNEDWNLIDLTNVRGPFWVCKHVAAAMLRHRRGGSIVNIASVLSVSADPMLTAYTASKHAVLGLTRSIVRGIGYVFRA